MKTIIVLFSILGVAGVVQSAPVKWRITFDQGNSGYFVYDPEIEDVVSWQDSPIIEDEYGGLSGTNRGISVSTLITEWKINGDLNISLHNFAWWNDNIGDIKHPPGSISDAAGHPPVPLGVLHSNEWSFGHGHGGDFLMSFSDIQETSASGSWMKDFQHEGEWSAHRVSLAPPSSPAPPPSSVPLLGAIPFFCSGLVSMLWLRRKNTIN
jgi:hypothetical protein